MPHAKRAAPRPKPPPPPAPARAPAPAPSRQPAADRRVQVAAAARTLFAREGEAASMRQVAAAAGVSPAALYLYFPDKQALMVAVCDSIFADLIAMFRDAAAAAPAGDPFGQLRRFMQVYVTWGLSHPAEYRLLFLVKEMHEPGHPGHRGPAVPGGPQLGPELFGLLEAEVARLVREGHFRPEDPTMAAEAIWASGHGLIALLTTLKAFPFTPAPELARFLSDVIIRGLARG